MKTVEIGQNDLTLEQILREAIGGDVVFLTEGGETRFAVIEVDEADREAFALGRNQAFMAYLDACSARAKNEPRKTLREMRSAED